MAPPMPFTILPGIIQLARLPSRSTCSAPRIVRSTWPPRTIAKESALEKYDGARQLGDRLLAGVDEVGVLLARLGVGPDAEHAVLGVQHDRDALRDVVGDQRRHADAEVDVVAVLHLLRGAPHDALALGVGLDARRRRAPSASRSASRSAAPWKMRCTKMPGVTTASGSSAPAGTSSSTSAIVRARGHGHHGREVARGRRKTRLPRGSPFQALTNAKSACSAVSRTCGPAVEPAHLLALGDQRAVAGRREERGHAGAAGAHALGEGALRVQLHLDLAGQVHLLEDLVLAHVGRDHLLHLLVLAAGT